MKPGAKDGAVEIFTSVEYYATTKTSVPVYKTFAAAFLDEKDTYDGK